MNLWTLLPLLFAVALMTVGAQHTAHLRAAEQHRAFFADYDTGAGTRSLRRRVAMGWAAVALLGWALGVSAAWAALQ